MGWLAETRLSTGRSLFKMQGEILLPGGQAAAGRPLPPDLNLAGGSVLDTEIWPGGGHDCLHGGGGSADQAGK